MKPIVFIIAESGEAPGELAQSLGAEFEVHCLPATGLASRDLNTAQLIAIFDSGAEDEFLRKVHELGQSHHVPHVLFAQGIAADRRVQLLEAGFAEILDPALNHAELVIRLRQQIESAEQAGKVTVLQDQLARLSQYFSDDVVKMILSQKSVNHDYGENLEATIFFLDIRNFTTISENVEPNLVAALLNRLYTDIMDLILTYKGSVNKIIGDALLSTFGCPVRGENDARNAVECALAIRDTIKLFNSSRPAYIHEDIAIGMGIATGRVFAGTIGSYRKRDYTVIGDTVNIAARLEGLTKQTRFDLIIDRKTRDLTGDGLKVRKLHVTRVRGRTQPMEIFLVDSLLNENSDNGAETVFFRR